MSIAGGIFGGIFLLAFAGATLESCKDDMESKESSSIRAELETRKRNIDGRVIDETYYLEGDYCVSITSSDSPKVVICYTPKTSSYTGEPKTLNTFFSKGDRVDLSVSTNKESTGNPRDVDLSGRLVEKAKE